MYLSTNVGAITVDEFGALDGGKTKPHIIRIVRISSVWGYTVIDTYSTGESYTRVYVDEDMTSLAEITVESDHGFKTNSIYNNR